MSKSIDNRYLTVDELAQLLRVKKSYIYHLTYTRQIGFLKVGKYIRFDHEEVTAWIESKRQKSEDVNEQSIKSASIRDGS